MLKCYNVKGKSTKIEHFTKILISSDYDNKYRALNVTYNTLIVNYKYRKQYFNLESFLRP